MNKLLPLLVFIFVGLLFFLPRNVFAQSATACAIIDIGTITGPTPPVPPECVSSGELPQGMKPCLPVGPQNSGGVAGEYCQIPPYVPNSTRTAFYSEPSLPNLYEKKEQSNKWQDWGAKEMLEVIYEVSKKWKQGSPANAHRPAIPPHPNGHIIFQDIASDYHIEHKFGNAVDIFATTDGKHCVASAANPGMSNWRCRYGPNDRDATVQLGQLFVDTGMVDIIWYSDPDGIRRIWNYMHAVDPRRYSRNSPGMTGIRDVSGHWDHFHLLLDRWGKKDDSHNQNFYYSKLKDCETLGGALRDVCF